MMSSARSFEDDGVQQLCQPHADKTVSASADTCTTVSASRWPDSCVSLTLTRQSCFSLTTMSASRWHDTFTLTVLRNHGASYWPCLAWETGNGERFHRSDWQSLQSHVAQVDICCCTSVIRHTNVVCQTAWTSNKRLQATPTTASSHGGVDFRSGVVMSRNHDVDETPRSAGHNASGSAGVDSKRAPACTRVQNVIRRASGFRASASVFFFFFFLRVDLHALPFFVFFFRVHGGVLPKSPRRTRWRGERKGQTIKCVYPTRSCSRSFLTSWTKSKTKY